MQRVQAALNALPVRTDLAREAYLHFQATGELPDNQRLAHAVVSHAKSGRAPDDWETDIFEAARIRRLLNAPPRPKDEIMDALYGEAVWARPTARDAAREVLKILSDLGADVTKPIFAERGSALKPPDWGTVGLWFLGFPECLATPPYEEQAHRLFERFAGLRERIDQDNQGWFDELEIAASRFALSGELPDDDLTRDCVLADGELTCLARNAPGVDDSELMAAFDAAARATDTDRQAAIELVQELVRDGRLRDGDGE